MATLLPTTERSLAAAVPVGKEIRVKGFRDTFTVVRVPQLPDCRVELYSGLPSLLHMSLPLFFHDHTILPGIEERTHFSGWLDRHPDEALWIKQQPLAILTVIAQYESEPRVFAWRRRLAPPVPSADRGGADGGRASQAL